VPSQFFIRLMFCESFEQLASATQNRGQKQKSAAMPRFEEK